MRLGQGERGYAMAALLVGLSVMAVLMTMAMPVWSHFAKREKEEELIWRGQQYARAIGLFQRKFANTFPPNVDVLVEQKFLRKKYMDPITKDDFQVIPAGGGVPNQPGGAGATQPGQSGQPPQGQATPTSGGSPTSLIKPFAVADTSQRPSIGIQGVVSKSTESSIKIYNGRSKYNEWAFVYMATSQRIGPAGAQKPGAPGQPQPGQSPFGPGVPGGVPQRPPEPNAPFGQPSQRPPVPNSPFGQPNQPKPQL